MPHMKTHTRRSRHGSLSTAFLALLLSFGVPCRAQAADLSSEDLARNNSTIKRWLEKEKRIFLNPISPDEVEVVLTRRTEPLCFLFIMGRYKQSGTNSAAQAEPKPPAAKVKEKDRLFKEVQKASADLLKDSTRSVVLLDEKGEPPPPAYATELDEKSLNSAFTLISLGEYGRARKLLQANQARLSDSMLINLAMLEAINGNIKKAEEILAKFSQDNPANATAQFNLAYLRLTQGKTKFAAALLKPLTEGESKGRLKLLSLLSLARLSLFESKREEAVRYSERALSDFPDSLDSLDTAGDIALACKDYKKAIQYLTPVAQARKSETRYLLKLAEAHQELGETDRAIRLLNQACDIEPESVANHVHLGKTYLANKDFLAARLQFERALELKPDLDEKRKIFAPFIKVLNTMNDDKALDKWTALWVKENPDQAITHYNRGWYLTRMEKNAEAIAAYRAALKCDAKMSTARYNLIYLLAKSGQREEARQEGQLFLNSAGSEADKKQIESMLASIEKLQGKTKP